MVGLGARNWLQTALQVPINTRKSASSYETLFDAERDFAALGLIDKPLRANAFPRVVPALLLAPNRAEVPCYKLGTEPQHQHDIEQSFSLQLIKIQFS